MSVTLRPATPGDARFWYELRNAPDVRKVSRSVKPIGPDEHRRWFHDSLAHPKRKLFIIEVSGNGGAVTRPVGFARLDHRGTWSEVSLALVEAARGHGIGKQAVNALREQAQRLKWPPCGAVVQGRNARSLRLFVGAGFVTASARWLQLSDRITKIKRNGDE